MKKDKQPPANKKKWAMLGSIFLASFFSGSMIAPKKKVENPRKVGNNPNLLANAKARYKVKREKLYHTGHKRYEDVTSVREQIRLNAQSHAANEAAATKEK
ncbi:hypothetical protein [Thalassobacillus pellis]|uniref:hypothetical protein n=1 Tax=Thalassobacillus pellis TaxID=748008 RepID=UPI00196034F6|nr:hypothetical protein [Thalassobacillus pellis]MBM7554162.1 hypothetical protein [Thalassobacillus pellis]